MTAPESLPAKAFLLAFHPEKHRLTARAELGYLLRAAALADLVHSGHLRDERGKAVVTSETVQDPVLAQVLAEASAKPAGWRWLVRRGRREIFHAVRDQLGDARVLRVEHSRALGLFPHTRIELRDTVAAKRIAEQVGRAIRGGRPASKIEPEVASLAALAAAVPLRVVVGPAEARRHRERLDPLGAPIEPVVTALRKAIRAQRAAAASSG